MKTGQASSRPTFSTMFMLSNSFHDFPEQNKIRWSRDLYSYKLWKGRSGDFGFQVGNLAKHINTLELPNPEIVKLYLVQIDRFQGSEIVKRLVGKGRRKLECEFWRWIPDQSFYIFSSPTVRWSSFSELD